MSSPKRNEFLRLVQELKNEHGLNYVEIAKRADFNVMNIHNVRRREDLKPKTEHVNKLRALLAEVTGQASPEPKPETPLSQKAALDLVAKYEELVKAVEEKNLREEEQEKRIAALDEHNKKMEEWIKKHLANSVNVLSEKEEEGDVIKKKTSSAVT